MKSCEAPFIISDFIKKDQRRIGMELSLGMPEGYAAGTTEHRADFESKSYGRIWDILKLHVAEEQKSFVASNDISIIEAYVAITGNGYAFPFGIYEDDKPIGFLMISFDTDDYWDDAPSIAKGNYNLWRLCKLAAGAWP